MMKRLLRSLLIPLLFIPVLGWSQLPDGSPAPDFTLTDIFGNTFNLYSLLAQDKMVALDFSATWCGPCWNYAQTGAMENFWNTYGPNGTNEAQAFFIEADESTGIDDLYGLTSGSQGNWVELIPFPIFDLVPGQSADEDYAIAYYPTLYAVCPDQTVWELGQVPASEWAQFIQSCQLAAEISNIQPATCYGQGSVTLDVEGGFPPLDYDWSNGDNDAVLNNVGAGTYSVTVTESNGKFVVIEDIIVPGQEEPLELADAEIEDALCYGAPSGSISISMSNGTPPYSYDWSNGASSQNLVNVTAGEYSVIVTDNNGCTLEESFEIDQPDNIEVVTEQTPDYCDQSSGTITLDIDGGTGTYDISASEGTVFGNQIIDLPSGNVVVTVEDANGCIWQQNFAIEGEDAPGLFFTPDPNISCIEPLETIAGFVTNGSGDYEYEWTTENGNIVGSNTQSTVTVDQPGDYDLLVTDIVTGCQTENSVYVNSTVEPPVASAGEDAPITCEISQLNLAGTGDPGYIVSWTTTNGNIVSGGDTYTPLVDAPGEYVMHVMNPANSCVFEDVAIVLDESNPAQAAFQYQSSVLTIIATDLSTGSNLSNWMWTFGDGNSATGPSVVHTYSTAGTYEVCLSVQNGCGVSQTCQMVEVTFTGSVITVDAVIGNIMCNGGTSNIVIQVNGGSGNYTFSWTGPEGATYTTQSLSDVPAGVYNLVISDDAGNIFIGEFILTEPDAIVISNAVVVDNLCYGDALGSVTIDLTGGVAPFTYSFNGGPAQPQNMIGNLQAGVVECLVTDANGCSFLAGPFTILEPDALQINNLHISNASNEEVNNGSIYFEPIGGVPPYVINWNNGATGNLIEGLVPGEYIYTIVDANGCTYTPSTPIIITGSVSTHNPVWANQITIAPNPSRGLLLVNWRELEFGQGRLSLYNLQGVKMTDHEMSGSTGSWNYNSVLLGAGVYMISMQLDDEQAVWKWIVID